MIEEAGFQSERHYAETKDGYILKIHRILKKSPIPQAGPVFMLHGVLETSADYIRTGPQLALRKWKTQNRFRSFKKLFQRIFCRNLASTSGLEM